MPSLRLTRRAVEEIPFAEKGQVLYRDTKLPGFGLRVGAQSKVFSPKGKLTFARGVSPLVAPIFSHPRLPARRP